MWEDPGDLWSYLGLAIVSVALIVLHTTLATW